MKTPKISKNPNVNWRNDDIQFPRLIAELEAAGVFQNPVFVTDVLESMDLREDQLTQLVERASNKWDRIKAKTAPLPRIKIA